MQYFFEYDAYNFGIWKLFSEFSIAGIKKFSFWSFKNRMRFIMVILNKGKYDIVGWLADFLLV
jgi:hypothetical protein